MDVVFQHLPVWVVLTVGGLLLVALIYLVVRALKEGREVAFWPPRIGPRISSPSHPPDDPSLATESRGDRSSGATIARLVVVNGEGELRIGSSDRSLLVGRTEPADLVLLDKAMSRVHFRITIQPTSGTRRRSYSFLLADCGSENGTFLNGEKVTTAQIGNGDRIEAGGTEFTFITT